MPRFEPRDTVNTASRIQDLTRIAGCALLVSGATLERAGGAARFGAEAVGEGKLRGRSDVVPVWAVAAW